MSRFRSTVVWSCDWGGEAAWNMAVDEAIYRHSGIRNQAWIRCYSWGRPSVSIGYFSKLSEVSGADGLEIVRRMTGGGVVEHGRDFTFSVSVPAEHEWAKMKGTKLYAFIHAAVGEELRGVCAARGIALADERETVTGAGGRCFERPVVADVMADGKKVVGGAMKRGREGVIYQGSVQLEGLGEEFARRLATRLGAGESCRLEGFPAAVRSAAERLVVDRYATGDWLARR